jgi:hypothetical protein
VKSIVLFGTHSKKLSRTATGVATSYAYDYSKGKRPGAYASPLLHHVLLEGEHIAMMLLLCYSVMFFYIMFVLHMLCCVDSASLRADVEVQATAVVLPPFAKVAMHNVTCNSCCAATFRKGSHAQCHMQQLLCCHLLQRWPCTMSHATAD